MASETSTTDHAKLYDLRQLAHAQITAIEKGDKKAFDQILAAKDTLINSFTDARGMVEADPALKTVVMEIQECDQTAQQILYRRIGRVMRELCELQKAKKARGAYYKVEKALPRRSNPFQPDTPRFIDKKF